MCFFWLNFELGEREIRKMETPLRQVYIVPSVRGRRQLKRLFNEAMDDENIKACGWDHVSADSDDIVCVVSDVGGRDPRAMELALQGVPLVTSKWLQTCIEVQKLVHFPPRQANPEEWTEVDDDLIRSMRGFNEQFMTSHAERVRQLLVSQGWAEEDIYLREVELFELPPWTRKDDKLVKSYHEFEAAGNFYEANHIREKLLYNRPWFDIVNRTRIIFHVA